MKSSHSGNAKTIPNSADSDATEELKPKEGPLLKEGKGSARSVETALENVSEQVEGVLVKQQETKSRSLEQSERPSINTLLQVYLKDVKLLLSGKLPQEVMERFNKRIAPENLEITFRIKEPGGTAYIYAGGPEDERVWNYDSGLTLEELKSLCGDKVHNIREYNPTDIDRQNDEAEEARKKLADALEKATEGVEHIEVGSGTLSLVTAKVRGEVVWSGLVWKDSESVKAKLMPTYSYHDKKPASEYSEYMENLFMFNVIRYLSKYGHGYGEQVAALMRNIDCSDIYHKLTSDNLVAIFEDPNTDESFSEQSMQLAKDVYRSCGVENVDELIRKTENHTVTDRSDTESTPSKK